MAARTTLADGSIRQWHVADLSECADVTCERTHATKAELFAGAGDARDRGFREGVDHR